MRAKLGVPPGYGPRHATGGLNRGNSRAGNVNLQKGNAIEVFVGNCERIKSCRMSQIDETETERRERPLRNRSFVCPPSQQLY